MNNCICCRVIYLPLMVDWDFQLCLIFLILELLWTPTSMQLLSFFSSQNVQYSLYPKVLIKLFVVKCIHSHLIIWYFSLLPRSYVNISSPVVLSMFQISCSPSTCRNRFYVFVLFISSLVISLNFFPFLFLFWLKGRLYCSLFNLEM